MKRNGWVTLGAALLLAVTLLVGCGLPAPADSISDTDTGQKNIYLAKQDTEGNVLFTITDQDQVDAFLDAYFSIPEDEEDLSGLSDADTDSLTPEWIYVVTQDKTVLAGETEPRGTEEVLRYTLYENSNVITMEIAPDIVTGPWPRWLSGILTFSAEADAETVAFLKECTGEDVTGAVS